MQSPSLIGELVVVALKAENLQEQANRKQDPFCLFRVNGIAKTTKIDYGGGSYPVWDDQVNIPLSHGHQLLHIQIFDRDTNPNNFMGEGMIDLSKVLKEREHDGYFLLKYKGQPAGEVYLEMTFYPLDHPKNTLRPTFQQRPPPPHHHSNLPSQYHSNVPPHHHSNAPPHHSKVPSHHSDVPSHHLVPLSAPPMPRQQHPGNHTVSPHHSVSRHHGAPQHSAPQHSMSHHSVSQHSSPHHGAPQHSRPPHHGVPSPYHHQGTPIAPHHQRPFAQPRPSSSAQTMSLLSSPYQPSPVNYPPSRPHQGRPPPGPSQGPHQGPPQRPHQGPPQRPHQGPHQGSIQLRPSSPMRPYPPGPESRPTIPRPY
ncbi:unnamed protein product [Rhizopus stolonifer]